MFVQRLLCLYSNRCKPPVVLALEFSLPVLDSCCNNIVRSSAPSLLFPIPQYPDTRSYKWSTSMELLTKQRYFCRFLQKCQKGFRGTIPR